MISIAVRDTDTVMEFPDGTSDEVIGTSIRKYFHGFKTKLSPDEESAFVPWYQRQAKVAGIDPDPDHPGHMYDYRGAYKAQLGPTVSPEDKKYHWPSQFKHEDHPNRYVDGVDTLKGDTSEMDMGAQKQARVTRGSFGPTTHREAHKPDLTAGRVASQAFRATSQGGADILRFMEQSQQALDVTEQYNQMGFNAADPKESLHFNKFLKEFKKTQGRNPTKEEIGASIIKFRELERIGQIDALKAKIEKFPKLLEGSSGLTEDAIVGLFRFLPSMSMSFANPIVGTAFTFTQIAGMKADEYAKQGVDPQRGLQLAVLSSLAQTPLEMAGNLLQIGALKNLVKTFKIKGPGAARIGMFAEALLKGGLGEGAEEFLQQYPDEIANIIALRPDLEPGEILSIVWEKLPEITKAGGKAAVVGALAGIFLAGAGGVVTQAAFTAKDLKARKERKAAEELGKFEPSVVPTKLPTKPPISTQKVGKPPTIPAGTTAEKAPVKMRAEKVAEIKAAAEVAAIRKADQLKGEKIGKVFPTKPEEDAIYLAPEEEKQTAEQQERARDAFLKSKKLKLTREQEVQAVRDAYPSSTPDFDPRVEEPAAVEFFPQQGPALGAIDVKVKAVLERTGEKLVIETDAESALRDVDDRIGIFSQLKECLG